MPNPADGPDPPPPLENPYSSPAAAPEELRTNAWRRLLIILLGLAVTPVAAFIGGFCCCYVGAMTVVPNAGPNVAISVMLFGFAIGAIAAGGLVLKGLVRWWKSLASRDRP